tara:strand:+ start:2131 stop:2526 length:396 start_codon:yes stop_codon:yes gene_type:complete
MKNKKLKKIKKGPLSNSEKSEIHNYLGEQQDAKSIAGHLNRSENIIQKFIDSITMAEDESAVPTAEEVETIEPPVRTRTSELFARNEKYGVTVMTPQASEAGDDSRHKRVKAATTHRYSNCTTTIRKASDD